MDSSHRSPGCLSPAGDPVPAPSPAHSQSLIWTSQGKTTAQPFPGKELIHSFDNRVFPLRTAVRCRHGLCSQHARGAVGRPASTPA